MIGSGRHPGVQSLRDRARPALGWMASWTERPCPQRTQRTPHSCRSSKRWLASRQQRAGTRKRCQNWKAASEVVLGQNSGRRSVGSPPKSGLPGRGRNSSTEERRAWLDWDGSDGVSDRLKSQGAIFLNRWGRAFDETFRAVTNFRGHVKRCRELVESAADELRIVQGLAQGDPVVLVRRAINLLAASFPSEDDWAHETANGEANQWDKVSAPPEWKSALSSLRAAAWTKGTAARPVMPVTEAVAAEIARKILTQMPAASKEAPTPPKVSGYTRKELIDAVRIAIDRPDWSPSAFDNIRKAAGVKARARGGAGSFQRFTNAEIRDLAAAAETGVFRWGKQIGVALRELIHPPPLVTQSNHKL